MYEEYKIGQYVLERKLGEGGMAEVWMARHLQLGSIVAIKFLLPGLANDPELEGRFLNEGKRQAGLRHPNILSAIDFIQQAGRSYLVMQYVDGENLETRLREKNGPLSLEEVHSISWDVLSALDYAHSVGVIHRDVKPSNILVENNGRVWLTDFGIALALTEDTRLTRTGTALGTAVYMSPEQIVRPKSVDSRADIYSFGCVLYAMLAGSPPFGVDGETDFYIKDCHVRTPPPPIVYRNPAINPAVEQVVRKCLEKSPTDRYQTCGAVMNALDAAIAGSIQVAVPATPPTAPPVAPPPPAPVQVGQSSVTAHARTATWQTITTQTPPPAPPVAPPAAVPVGAVPKPPAKAAGGRKLVLAIAIVAILAAVGVGYFLIGTPPETVLRLEGSTTVGDALAPALLKAFLVTQGAKDIEVVPGTGDKKDHHDVRAKLPDRWRPVVFSVVANGSPNAFKALDAGRADIGMASRPIKDDEVKLLQNIGDMRSPSCEYVVGLDGIAVIVNRSNSVPPLTKQQLAAIFRGTVTDWGQVGAKPGPIHLYGRSSDSGTFDTFVSLVLGGDKNGFAHSLKVEPSGDDIAKQVASDPAGIGYVGLAQIGDATALELSAGTGTTPLLPSPFTVSTEDYILSRRLFFYLPAKPTEFAQKFAAFAVSPEGQKVVKEVGFVEQTPHFEQVPIPADAPSAYRQRVAGLRRMSLNFRFRPNSFELDTKALADIPRAIAALSQNGDRTGVQILGFADSKGSPQQNQKLSEQRAQVVADKLRAYGIEVETAGFSSSMPVGDNNTDEGREKNRRVEVWAR
jgi:phosphate transport system substrate-binding protein